MAQLKEENKALESRQKETDMHELPDKKFKITVFERLVCHNRMKSEKNYV